MKAEADPAARCCERPLVVRCGAFGDMVLITALIGELQRRFRRDVDVLTSGPWSEPLLRGQPGVGEVYCVRSRKTPFWLSRQQQRAVRQLRLRGVGPTWFCDGNDAALPMLLRAGFTTPSIVDVRDHPLLPGEHATEQWRRLALLDPPRGLPAGMTAASAASASSATPRTAVGSRAHEKGGCQLIVSAAEHESLTRWLAARGLSGLPLFAVQVGNKRTMRRGFKRLAVNSKHWPIERWAAVLRHVRQRHPCHVIVLLGTGPEYELNRELAELAHVGGVHNAADDLPVPRLVALLARADGLLTVDSGPAHVGAAVGCPQVVLFGKASTSLYRPWSLSGADVKVITGTIEGKPDMMGISAAEVIAAWDTLQLRSAPATYPG